MHLKMGDHVTWSTLPNGQGIVKKGFVQEVSGRWITLLCTKAPADAQADIGTHETTLIEFILEPYSAVQFQPRLF